MKTPIVLTFGLLLISCSYFKRKDFISTEFIGEIAKETFFYSAYQTGIDNYTIEFKVVVNQDTSKILDYYINDALYTKEHSFLFNISHDTLIVSTPFQSCKNV